MKTLRIILAAVLSLASVTPALAFDRVLPTPRIKDNGDVRLSDDLKIGRFQEGAYIATPDAIETSGQIKALNFDLTGIAPLNSRHASVKNPNTIMVGPGNSVSFCPELSCVISPNSDHQRASLFVSAQTQDDGHSEEQTVAITTTIKTGAYKTWAPNTQFNLGDNVNFQDARNAVYRVTQAGVSGNTGGPTGKGAGIVDGTVRWSWINDAAINAKVGLYNEVNAVAGGGNSWAQANNFLMQPGFSPKFATNTELDFTNNSGTDCVPGLVAGCNNLYLRTYGTSKSTSHINVEGPSEGTAVAYFGAYFHGSRLSSDATIEIDTGGVYGLRFGGFSPAAYSGAALVDLSTSARGIQLAGTYSAAQISGAGWSIDPAGSGLLANLSVTGQVYEPSPFVPPLSTTPCAKGQHSWDANYEYRCVATNTWKRAALSTW